MVLQICVNDKLPACAIYQYNVHSSVQLCHAEICSTVQLIRLPSRQRCPWCPCEYGTMLNGQWLWWLAHMNKITLLITELWIPHSSGTIPTFQLYEVSGVLTGNCLLQQTHQSYHLSPPAGNVCGCNPSWVIPVCTSYTSNSRGKNVFIHKQYEKGFYWIRDRSGSNVF